ncbi:MAG: hypothetical protein ACRCT1_04640, partial [Microcoleaceae cyanobacterium]
NPLSSTRDHVWDFRIRYRGRCETISHRKIANKLKNLSPFGNASPTSAETVKKIKNLETSQKSLHLCYT